jgi:hypothetical protein
MTMSRRQFAIAAGSSGLALTGLLDVFAQDALAVIPEGPLREQVAWFVNVMNRAPGSVTAGEIEEHFSAQFLEQVPAAQMLGIVDQMKPMLGAVTVEDVTVDASGTEARVLLAGGTGLYILLTMVVNPESGLIDGLLLQPAEAPDNAGASAVASPASSPAATPATVIVPPTTDEILADYQAAVDELMTLGREVTEALIAGDHTVLSGMLGESLVAAMEGMSAGDAIAELTTDIVSFSLTEAGASFAGRYTPDEISGFFHQGTPAAFRLVPNGAQSDVFPSGAWSGDIIIGSFTLGIDVTFEGTADDLSATISIPEQGLFSHPLSDVRFDAQRPLDALIDERALPMGPSMGTSSYGAVYEWGNALLAINSAFDEDGKVIGLTPVMQVPLPPDPAGDVDVATTFQVPFDGAWMVVWGGESEFRNYHSPVPQQRFAHDIVIWRDGATYSGDGTQNEQYHCYGQPQYAPAGGTVVVAVDEYPDDTPGVSATSGPAIHPAGNHIVIEVAEGEYVLLAHFIPGSIAVAEGDTVAAGDVIGLTGNSGNSSEPHIHMHMQTGPDMLDPATIGLPMEFENVLVNGEPRDSAIVEQGQIIERA